MHMEHIEWLLGQCGGITITGAGWDKLCALNPDLGHDWLLTMMMLQPHSQAVH